MDLKLGAGTLLASFDDGDMAGLTIKIYGDNLMGNTFGAYTRSARVVKPIQRMLSQSEILYVKQRILEYCEDWIRKVEFD